MAQTISRSDSRGRVKPIRKQGRELPWPANLYQTAVGKKYIMALTGIGVLGFVLVHMIGNLHIYQSPLEVNEYGEALRDLGGNLIPRTLLLWILRVGLTGMFVLHIHSAWSLNRMSEASNEKYQSKRDYIAVNFASRTMRWTGPIILLYLLFHLADLTWGWWLGDTYIRGDVYHNVTESMSSIPVAIIYIVANVALAVHIYHGTWSLFQSLGVNNPRYNSARRGLATGLSVIILAGNLSFPIMVQAGLISEDNRTTPAAGHDNDGAIAPLSPTTVLEVAS